MHIQEVSDQFSLDRVVPYFQPIMDLQANSVWRYECLARLVMPNEQTFLPSDFLHLVERHQVGTELTETIFYRSANYFKDFNVSWNINLSAQDMENRQLLHMLEDYQEQHGTRGRVYFEVTAGVALNDVERFARFVEQCHAQSIGIVVDHITGDNDIAPLFSLPIKGCKVAAVRLCDPQQAARIDGLLASADRHGVKVIAEHVESATLLDGLQERGIRFAQGFYFCQPLAQT
ncbi:EAL domain-containing protein [Aestuariibacter halophilus]|uniref:EAL domain-containing protein n=1 Tax=Fluctibacter halophilus TaxID=226011 RepID=A0ABS8G9D0_9ALTE|nr:EAL domain-containing protein [Aestuariibacter halophilus]MCC2617150.1 EAL domain-containing protein [Aestuariibacter halophilus]